MDGWRSFDNDQLGLMIPQPKRLSHRARTAGRCRAKLLPSIPMLVDDMDDRVSRDYSAQPDRLYVIGTDGRIAYKSGRGPFGFLAGEMEQALVTLLLAGGR